jgi:hypothetical protein
MSTPTTRASETASPRILPTVAIIGLVISSLALAGWLVILIAIFTTPKAPPTGDPMGDVLIAPGNGLMYLLQVLIGLVGLCVNGTLSLVGTLVSAAGLSHEPKRIARIGLGLGVVGLLVGVGLVVWRLAAWDML